MLERSLQEIFGEGDAALRLKVANEILHDDAVFVETHGICRGSPSDQAGRVRWVAGAPGETPAYSGTDFIAARDGKIAAIYLFFDGAPDQTSPPIEP